MSVPLVAAYVTGWMVAVGTFAFCYHRRKHRKVQVVEPWFGPDEARENYYSLVESNAPGNILKPALVRRAMSCIRRFSRLADGQMALQMLLRSGAVGDDLWAEWQAAKVELEADIADIQAAAETFKEGWGKQIMGQAAQMLQRELEKEAKAEAERAAVEEEEGRKRREEREKAEMVARDAAERARIDRLREELIRQDEREKKSKHAKHQQQGVPNKKSKKR